MNTKEKLQQAAKQYDKTAHCGQFAGEDPSYHYLNGAKSPESLEYWKEKKKLYSEDEVWKLVQNLEKQIKEEYSQYDIHGLNIWFEQNRKK